MKILHLVSSPTLTGPADPALALARIERKVLGFDSAIAFDTTRPGNMAEKAAAASVPMAGGLLLSTQRGLASALRDRKVLRELAAEHDILHAHASHDHALAVLSRGKKARARIVRTVHHPRSANKRGAQGLVYRRTDGFVLVAEAHRRVLLESYPKIDPAICAVIPGAVDTERFHPGKDGLAFRRSLELEEGAFVVAVVSRIKPGRRHDVLVAAFAELCSEIDRARLLVIGKGEGLPDLRADVAGRGLDPVVRFAGFRDADLPEAIAAADVTVLLSEGNDANCRAVLESLAAGVPVVGGRHPAIAEALEGADCGTLVDPDDAHGIAAALIEAARMSPDAAAARRRNARSRAVARYSESRLGHDVAAFYARILARGRR